MEDVPFNICEALLRGKDMRIVTTSFTGIPGKQRYVATVTKKDDEEIYSLRKYAPIVKQAEINHLMTVRHLQRYGWGRDHDNRKNR